MMIRICRGRASARPSFGIELSGSLVYRATLADRLPDGSRDKLQAVPTQAKARDSPRPLQERTLLERFGGCGMEHR